MVHQSRIQNLTNEKFNQPTKIEIKKNTTIKIKHIKPIQ